MASILIKGIYYAVSDLKGLYNKVKVGDAVMLRQDKRNTCDDLAIAVYYDFERIGFVEMSRVVEVCKLLPDGSSLAVHIDQIQWNEEDPKKSTMSFCIEDAKLESDDYSEYLPEMELPDDVWGNLKPPFLVYNEEGVKMLVAEFVRRLKLCLSMNVRDVENSCMLEQITKMTERYMDFMSTSLSGDITLSMNAIRSGLQQFRRTFTGFEKEFDGLCQRLEDKLSERAHELSDIYHRQISSIRTECERDSGFFYRYSMMYLKTVRPNMVPLLDQRIAEVKNWLGKIPEDIAGFYFNDELMFVEKLYYKRLPCITLNRIYLHVLLFEHLTMMRKDPVVLELEKEMAENKEENEKRIALVYQHNHLHIHMEGGTYIENQTIYKE